jgi:hypothetical protein
VSPAKRRVVAVLLAIVAFFGANLGSWGNIASIVAAVAAVLLVIAGIVGWLRRRFLLREPVRITYFIRQANYNRSGPIEGAPEREQYPSELSVGENGIYEVMHRLVAAQAIWIEDIRLEPRGPVHLPENNGPTMPMQVDTKIGPRGETQWLDWHGVWHTEQPLGARMLSKGDVFVIGHEIRTGPAWEGVMRLSISLRADASRASKTHRKLLPFTVGSDDQLRFMRREP